MLQEHHTTEAGSELGRPPDLTLDQRLDDIQRDVRTQGSSLKRTSGAFTIFAVLALLISAATLITVAAKLDKRTPTAATSATPAASAPAATAPLPSTAAESLTEMKITGPSTVAAGKVTFKIRNNGAVPHELVVLKTPIAAGKLPTSAAGKASETGNIGETGDMKVGAGKTLTLNLAAGHYALVCNLPGHYTGGMYSDLTVK